MSYYYDISPEISPEISVWPGDVSFSRKIHVDFKTGGNLLLSSIQSTLHLGAHADAPNHYHAEGDGISERDLTPYLGLCQVIQVNLALKTRIYPKDLGGKKIVAPRVLLKTNSFPNPNIWNSDFNSLSPELVHFLAEQNPKLNLIGIDTPSVDLMDDSKLISHQAIYQHRLAILEGLILTEVPEGVYTLVALPLKLKNADASPVRAILVKGDLNAKSN